MSECETIAGCVNEDSAFALMARFEVDGSAATIADVNSITWKCFDVGDPGTVVDSGTLTVSSVVFNTLQADGRWTADSTGYNFRHDVASDVLTASGKRYRFEHLVTVSGGNQFYLTPFEVMTKAVWSS